MPRFSIVMPCFNSSATLAETLESLFAQTCQDWELICVDDGSTDGTQKLLTRYADEDPRVRWIANCGKGPSSARNYGALTLAKGEIIAFCDSDDLWRPNKLAELDRGFDADDADVLYGQIGFFDDRPEMLSTTSTVPGGDVTIQMLWGESPVCTLSNTSIRRRSLLVYGGFDPSVVHNEDLEWLVRLVGQGALVRGIDSLHVLYRASPTGLSSDLEAMAAGRQRAIATAASFGIRAPKGAEATYQRYLARRALRMGQSRRTAAQYALRGLTTSPKGFMSPPRRGALTLAAVLSNFLLPRAVSRALFS